VSGALNETFNYNALGQLTSDARGTYTYTPTGRLATVTGPVTASYGYDPDDMRWTRTVNGHTVYTVRGAGQQVLSEYSSACAGVVWSRDLLYAGGRLIGAVKSTATQKLSRRVLFLRADGV